MRILVLADVHGNKEALESVLKQVPDIPYIFAGDLLDYGSNPLECALLLSEAPRFSITNFTEDKVVTKYLGCLGNHDIASMNEDYTRFRTEHGKRSAQWSHGVYELCPTVAEFLESNWINQYKGLMVCHGSDIDPWKNVFINDTETMDAMIERNPDIDIFIIAHSHLQFVKPYRGKIFLNPGSVGQSRNGVAKAHYAIIDTKFDDDFTRDLNIELHSVSYDIDSASKEISKNPMLDNFLATRLYLGI